ncbi:MAG: trehalose-6-phosphate synthase [Peptococcaceae bacterium]|nr:trehalose-6-phosphate synthase [Peptococcaceae bacterium]
MQEKQKPASVVVISNRGPFVLGSDRHDLTPAAGGLVSALEPVISSTGGTWVAWGGRVGSPGSTGLSLAVPPDKPRYHFREVMLTRVEFQEYYLGFANSALWPLCHCFIERCLFDPSHWQTYTAVNRRFAETAAAIAKPDSFIWVHDYHLALVPAFLRRRKPGQRIALFWHIPFPPYDVFRTLPWGKQIITGMLGSDTLGFHTAGYARNFLECVREFIRVPVNVNKGLIRYEGRQIVVRSMPIGIDWQEFDSLARESEVQEKARAIRRAVGAEYILLGVDRLDYTKGIPERIQAIEILLQQYPPLREQLALIQIAVPTRSEVEAYSELRTQVEQEVGRINGLYSKNYHVPIHYRYASVSRRELVAHFLAADVVLVTALRDGLNLVAKEFAASRIDRRGALLLSSFTGAAVQLTGALTVNPYDPADIAAKIKEALDMSPEEQERRMRDLRQVVQYYDRNWWWQQVMETVYPAGVNKTHAFVN